jgi:hypothetical protein
MLKKVTNYLPETTADQRKQKYLDWINSFLILN